MRESFKHLAMFWVLFMSQHWHEDFHTTPSLNVISGHWRKSQDQFTSELAFMSWKAFGSVLFRTQVLPWTNIILWEGQTLENRPIDSFVLQAVSSVGENCYLDSLYMFARIPLSVINLKQQLHRPCLPDGVLTLDHCRSRMCTTSWTTKVWEPRKLDIPSQQQSLVKRFMFQMVHPSCRWKQQQMMHWPFSRTQNQKSWLWLRFLSARCPATSSLALDMNNPW